jgi:hypothetical protein
MRTWNLTIGNEVKDVACEADIDGALAHLPHLGEDDETEICLRAFDDGVAGPCLTALIHGGQGWLMYLRFDGDPGFSTRNPAHHGPPDALVTYTLSNGQGDEYPASWAYPTRLIPAAFLELHRTGERPTGFEWFDDSA